MTSPTGAVVGALATYRATKLVLDDQIFEEPRAAVLKKLYELDTPASRKAAYFLTCPWCVSIWAAGGLVLLKKVSPAAYDALTTVLAASAVTGVLYERVG